MKAPDNFLETEKLSALEKLTIRDGIDEQDDKRVGKRVAIVK